MRILVVDLLCNSPYYCAPLVAALNAAGATAELASPQFYLEPSYLAGVPRPRWLVDVAVHARRPRALRLAARAIEVAINGPRLLAAIRRGSYDVVHVQWIPFEARSPLFMRRLRSAVRRGGARLVVTVHNALPHDRPGTDVATIRGNLDAADRLIALTAGVAGDMAGIVGVSRAVDVIPHGPLFVDQPIPERDVAARRLGLPIDRPTVLFLGLIRPYKGIDLLAEAWPEVRAAVPTAQLVVVGRRADRAAEDQVERIRALDGVTVTDRYVSVSEMVAYHAASDVVVFPYRRISQSGALMTALGLGRPTVVTPIPGLRDQVAGFESPMVADDVTAAALARALVAALRDPSGRRAAAERDRGALDASATGWPAIARATLETYERAAGDRAVR